MNKTCGNCYYGLYEMVAADDEYFVCHDKEEPVNEYDKGCDKWMEVKDE
ncbi:MAG TPA: hypothetical protein VN258_06565 [Mobilitalea sp.]|nr:hypothetical protein [Mobilitalea sp.]